MTALILIGIITIVLVVCEGKNFNRSSWEDEQEALLKEYRDERYTQEVNRNF